MNSLGRGGACGSGVGGARGARGALPAAPLWVELCSGRAGADGNRPRPRSSQPRPSASRRWARSPCAARCARSTRTASTPRWGPGWVTTAPRHRGARGSSAWLSQHGAAERPAPADPSPARPRPRAGHRRRARRQAARVCGRLRRPRRLRRRGVARVPPPRLRGRQVERGQPPGRHHRGVPRRRQGAAVGPRRLHGHG